MKCWRCGSERELFKCERCKELKEELPGYNQRLLRKYNKEMSKISPSTSNKN